MFCQDGLHRRTRRCAVASRALVPLRRCPAQQRRPWPAARNWQAASSPALAMRAACQTLEPCSDAVATRPCVDPRCELAASWRGPHVHAGQAARPPRRGRPRFDVATHRERYLRPGVCELGVPSSQKTPRCQPQQAVEHGRRPASPPPTQEHNGLAQHCTWSGTLAEWGPGAAHVQGRWACVLQGNHHHHNTYTTVQRAPRATRRYR